MSEHDPGHGSRVCSSELLQYCYNNRQVRVGAGRMSMTCRAKVDIVQGKPLLFVILHLHRCLGGSAGRKSSIGVIVVEHMCKLMLSMQLYYETVVRFRPQSRKWTSKKPHTEQSEVVAVAVIGAGKSQ